MREFVLAHPKAVGVVLALSLAYSAYGAFEVGLKLGMHLALDDTARTVSEALGG
jgi:hypothetical protein